MSDRPRSTRTGSHWKRPPTKVYDYNYDVGSNYYKGMINHLDKKYAGVSTEPPGPKSFAERIADDPLYGNYKPVNYVSSDIPSSDRRGGPSVDFARRTSLGDFLADDDSFGRSRGADRYRAPSVSDQIMDHAGVRADQSLLDDALAVMKKKTGRSEQLR